MNQAGDILLVHQPGLQRIHYGLKAGIRLINGLKGYQHVVVLQILDHQCCMVAFFLRLNPVPVGEPIQALFYIKVRKLQVKVGGIELFIDLCVEQIGYFFIQHYTSLLL
ncbi:Uncharacterised protein [uncultured Ruminococcus sp.]|nr:Uncharacterised protein [uncultured Ruminococcus sp.]